MTSDGSTDSIIDLLYGEISEEEEATMRKELAESADLRAELDSYEDMLGRIREAMPPEDVSPSVHASIMEAARAGAEKSSEERVARRQPVDNDEPISIWKRLGGSQGSQIALVAAVLVAGLFVVEFVDRGSSPTMAPASDISAAREPAPPVAAKGEAVPDENMKMEAEVAALEEGEEAPGDDAVAWGSEPESPAEATEEIDVERDLRKELAVGAAERSANTRKAEKPKAEPKPKPRRRTRGKKSAPSRPASKTASKKKADAPVDLWGADDSDKDSAFGGGETAALEDGLAAKEGRGNAGPAPEADEAEATAPPAQEQQAYQPEAGTISEVEAYARTGDHKGTVRAADEFLQSGGGSSSQRARALLLKANALERQGRYTQAKRVFQSLKKNYPDYNSSSVDAAIDRVDRATRKKPRPQKRKAKPKSTADEYQMESFD